jgi:hypothetical protein
MSYAKLLKPSVSVPRIIERITEANETNEWVKIHDKIQSAIELDVSLFEQDSDLMSIITFLGSEKRIRVLRTLPWTTYDWHKDSGVRYSAINLLVTGHNTSLTLFGTSHSDKLEHRDVERVQYEENSFYLINLQREHMVLNLSDETRYAVTIGFSLPYEHLHAICRARKFL